MQRISNRALARITSAILVLCALVAVRITLADEAPKILSMSPTGTVKEVRQVRVTFSDAMIAFGDPRASDPFNIDCPPKGHGRWADVKNWIYDFEKDLGAGVRCKFKAKPGLKTQAGKALEGGQEFSFDTGGPAIKRTDPWEGAQVEEAQAFVLMLDAPVDAQSVSKNAYFLVDGVQDHVGVNILEEDPRFDPGDKSPEAKTFRERMMSKIKIWAHKFGYPTRIGKHTAGDRAQIAIVAKQKFPADAKVTLVWDKGIKSQGGMETKDSQTIPYRVRPQFSAEFSCERENENAACTPISAMRLSFTAPVAWKDLKNIRLKVKSGSNAGKDFKPFVNRADKIQDDSGLEAVTFEAPLPEKQDFQIVLPKNLKDDAGRELSNASRFPLDVATANYPPLLKFAANFGIIELKPEAVLPVTLRNLELNSAKSIDGKMARLTSAQFPQMLDWMTTLEKRSYDYDHRDKPVISPILSIKTQPISIPKPNGDRAFEVVGVPFKEPGFYLVEFKSQRLGDSLIGKNKPMYVAAGALVTNMSVHFKKGRESSVVWVTALDTGKPVSGAAVTIRSCSGATLYKGVTDNQGLWKIPTPISEKPTESCSKFERSGLYAAAEKDGDFSFVHTSWEKGIESWRFNLPRASRDQAEIASTVMDRTLFRAGETVHLKNYFRRHSMIGIQAAPMGDYPKTLKITHTESDQSYEQLLQWKNGIAENTFTIPPGAKLGEYSVTLLARAPELKKEKSPGEEPSDADMEGDGGDDEEMGSGPHGGYHHARYESGPSWSSGEFRVEEFRIPLMRGKIKPPAEKAVAPKEIPLDLTVEYLAGGGAGKLPVQVRYQTSPITSGTLEDFNDFEFASGKVKLPEERADQTASESPDTDEYDVNEEAGVSTQGPANASKATKQSLTLDASGSAHTVIPVSIKQNDLVHNLQVELEYQDPNGETQTVSSSVPIYPSGRLVGIKPDSWAGTKSSLKFQVAVADIHHKAIPHATVDVDLLEMKNYSHRKRLVGGFYAYTNKTELNRLGPACHGVTDEKGLLSCETKPTTTGNLILEARTSDEKGNVAYTHSSTWVYDSDDWWFSQEDSDRIDLLPEKKHYEVGEKAVFQVRMPFREAMALVTVEREGILDSFTVPLSGKKPLIEIPIKANYSPNVFISALVIRGRVGDPQPTALVDLGRPSYKLGISQLSIGWKPHELKVKVQPSKEVYQVRENGKFAIHVETADGRLLPKGSEVALAAVDEGLLQLKPNESWKLLDAMMSVRGYEVDTYTAQTQVVGKRHFGLKAQPVGGDGGKAPSRQLFNSLLYWKGSVVLDEHGNGEVSFPMNDSITGFKIAAIAHAADDLFGTGYASIRTTQDLMVLSGIPPLAREGDHFALDLTLRNTTAKPMTVDLIGKATGVADLKQAAIALGANESKIVAWNVEIPAGITTLSYEIQAQQKDGKATDRLKIDQKVIAAVPTHIFQATLSQLETPLKMPIERPKDAVVGKGGVRLILNPSLLTGLDGVKDYMGWYPYTCMEQRVSKAIALQDKKLFDAAMADLPSYLDSDGLVRYFPSNWIHGSDILSAYLVSIINESGWEIPSSSLDRILDGLQGFVEGKITRIDSLPTSDLELRKISALEALSRYNRATWEMVGSLKIEPNLWPTSGLIDWKLLLRRLESTPEIETRKKEADQILRSRLNFQGTMMGFSTENIDSVWWMMVSVSENANRMLLTVMDEPQWQGDMGRMARGAIYRQKMGHWDTTTANAWGVLAYNKFAAKYEKDPVTGVTSSTLDSKKLDLDWKLNSKGKIEDFDWPAQGTGSLQVSHQGTGKPWLTVQSRAAIPLKTPLSSGYHIQKTVTPIEQKIKGKWSRGDIMRVHLDLEAQTDMTWVVVNDPIPAGATILGGGLGNDSAIATTGEKTEGWANPAFQERAFDGYRAYYEFVPKGKWSLEYSVRLNQVGQMSLPTTRVEAMYAPEMFGESPNDSTSVTP